MPAPVPTTLPTTISITIPTTVPTTLPPTLSPTTTPPTFPATISTTFTTPTSFPTPFPTTSSPTITYSPTSSVKLSYTVLDFLIPVFFLVSFLFVGIIFYILMNRRKNRMQPIIKAAAEPLDQNQILHRISLFKTNITTSDFLFTMNNDFSIMDNDLKPILQAEFSWDEFFKIYDIEREILLTAIIDFDFFIKRATLIDIYQAGQIVAKMTAPFFHSKKALERKIIITTESQMFYVSESHHEYAYEIRHQSLSGPVVASMKWDFSRVCYRVNIGPIDKLIGLALVIGIEALALKQHYESRYAGKKYRPKGSVEIAKPIAIANFTGSIS
eukprot:TRINITY_DN9460_c0_g1_i1.p1 TRINITY_DN9460_c0_g1~~TRINITY_DN9460_c0_g1_i1.p1  ORF type:complete len:328 (-),score=12.15 TRINITY_DN9460_c0_g1_i1:96-1079(-)